MEVKYAVKCPITDLFKCYRKPYNGRPWKSQMSTSVVCFRFASVKATTLTDSFRRRSGEVSADGRHGTQPEVQQYGRHRSAGEAEAVRRAPHVFRCALPRLAQHAPVHPPRVVRQEVCRHRLPALRRLTGGGRRPSHGRRLGYVRIAVASPRRQNTDTTSKLHHLCVMIASQY